MTDNSDETPENDNFDDGIDWKSEEEARDCLENGFNPFVDEYPPLIGNGEYVSRFRATYGANKKEFIRCQRLIDEERYPEIYSWKKGEGTRYLVPDYGDISENRTHISKEEFINLYSAVCFANSHGAVLTAHTTIPWGSLGYTDHAEAADLLQRKFINSLQSWYNDHIKEGRIGGEPYQNLYWIYSNECGEKHGFHTHFLVGIPNEKVAEYKIWAIKKFIKLSKIKPAIINNPSKAIVAPPSDPMRRQWERFQYLCKGLDPSATMQIKGHLELFPLSDIIQYFYENPGHIKCKNRVGLSGNLWPKVREKAYFSSLMEKGGFDKRELYPLEIPESWRNQNKYPEIIHFEDTISDPKERALFCLLMTHQMQLN